MNQVRPLRWHDLPLAYRLIGHGTSFDAQLSLVSGDDGLRHRLLANSGNTHSFVLRKSGGAFAVLRCLPGSMCASLSYIAPGLGDGGDEQQWLALIGGMSVLAGQRGIVAIRAEAGDDTPEFAALREAGFGVYGHQTVWERPPSAVNAAGGTLRAASSDEIAGLMGALSPHAPSLLKQANILPGIDAECYALEARHKPSGMAAVYRGAGRALIDVYVPIDGHMAAGELIGAVLRIAGADTTTITCRLRHDMEWVGSHLTEVGFDWLGSQAIMVRHTMAHIRRFVLKELHVKKGTAPITSHIGELEPARSSAHDSTTQPV